MADAAGGRRVKVLCVGQLAADILVRPVDAVDFRVDTLRVDGIDIRNGGDCLNVALGLARLGNDVAFAGLVGTDQLGEYLAGVVAEAGIDARGLRRTDRATTCACLVLINAKGERVFFYHGGTNDLFSRDDVDDGVLAECGFVHVGGTFLLPRFDGGGAASLFARARSEGRRTSMDVTWDTTGRWLSTIAPCLPHLDYFLPSEREAAQMTGQTTPDDMAAFLLDRGVGTVVVKMGEQGCYVRPSGGQGVRVKAFPARVVDTTGAGDSFVAGFLTGVLRGWEPPACATFACAVAAINIGAVGATGGIPRFEEAMRFVQQEAR
jgi:sugar/nucleoside kinase (ribokinase family)